MSSAELDDELGHEIHLILGRWQGYAGDRQVRPHEPELQTWVRILINGPAAVLYQKRKRYVWQVASRFFDSATLTYLWPMAKLPTKT